MTDKDVTELVEYGHIDDENLPIDKCVCGKRFAYWDFVIFSDDFYPTVCPSCGRKLYFVNNIKIYEVVD